MIRIPQGAGEEGVVIMSDATELFGPERDLILDRLSAVIEPDLAIDIVSLGMVREVTIWREQNEVLVRMALPCYACPIWDLMTAQIEEVLLSHYSRVTVDILQQLALPRDMSIRARSSLRTAGILAGSPERYGNMAVRTRDEVRVRERA